MAIEVWFVNGKTFDSLFLYKHVLFSLSLTATCAVGFEPSPLNNRVCSGCELGFYSDKVGLDACTMCPAYTTTVNLNSTVASDCYREYTMI